MMTRVAHHPMANAAARLDRYETLYSSSDEIKEKLAILKAAGDDLSRISPPASSTPSSGSLTVNVFKYDKDKDEKEPIEGPNSYSRRAHLPLGRDMTSSLPTRSQARLQAALRATRASTPHEPWRRISRAFRLPRRGVPSTWFFTNVLVSPVSIDTEGMRPETSHDSAPGSPLPSPRVCTLPAPLLFLPLASCYGLRLGLLPLSYSQKTLLCLGNLSPLLSRQ